MTKYRLSQMTAGTENANKYALSSSIALNPRNFVASQAQREAEAALAQSESYNNGGFFGGLGYLGEKAAVGFMSSIEGIWDYAAGGLAKLFGADDWAEQQFANDWFGDWYSHPEEWYNPSDGWKVAGDIAGGIGTSLPAIASVTAAAAIAYFSGGTLSPVAAGLIGAGVAGFGAAGTSTKQAYLESGQLSGKEFGYGALSGFTEGALEGVSSALSMGTGQIVNSVTKSFAKETTKTVAKQSVIKTLAKGFIGEAFEEGMSEILDPVWQRMTYDKNAENATLQEVAYAAFVGGMSGMIMSGGNAAIDSGNSFLKGNSLVGKGLDTEVMGLSQQLSEFEGVNHTGDETFQSIAQTYADLAQSLATTDGKVTTVTQKKLLGDLHRANTVAVFKPMIARSAANIVNNADLIAQRLNEYGYKTTDGKPITFTAEQIREGVDTANPTSFSEALKKNGVLRTLAIADTTGHLVMDTARFEQATLMGKRLASQVDLNSFIETATPSEINAVSQALGIENWATLDVDTFNQKIADFVENGGVQQYADRRAMAQTIQAIPAETARPMPKMVNLRQDGSVRYSDGSTQIAITRQGDAYTVYDYASGHLSKNMTRSEVNKLLRDYNTKQADILAGARTQMEAESELRRQAEEIDAYARENIEDYTKLSTPNQSMIRKVIREGRANGMTDADVLTYAKISAHAGIDITFDKQSTFRGYDEEGKELHADGFYDPKTNRIVVNPESKRSHERLLLHELEHTILNGKDGRKLMATAFENMDEDTRAKILKRYGDFYRGKGLDAAERIDILNDEVSAHFAEDILSNRHTLEKLIEAEPSLKDKILSFFKGASEDYKSVPKLSKAARQYYKTYKKLFDEFTERNFQNNATEAQTARLSGDVSDTRFSLQFADHIADNQRRFVLSNNVALTQDELELAIEQTAHMVEIMSKYKDILPADTVPKKAKATLVKNGSYDISVENTTICVRTLAYNSFVEMVSEKIGRPLTQMESFLVSQKLYDIAKEPQCLYCYVSLDRKAYNDMVLKYIDQRETAIEAYERAGRPEITSESHPLYQEYLAGRKATKPQWKRYTSWIEAYRSGDSFLTREDVATESRRAELARTGSPSQKAQLKDLTDYAQNASQAKKQTDYVAYYDDILRLSAPVVRNLNKHYGLRWYSFSDYSGAFIVENMQQITDASIRGLKGLAYTKDADFVRIFAPTGMNINVSVFVKENADGTFSIDPKQSANATVDELIELRKKYPNVGVVATATSDAGVEWALTQDWTDVVIPFHIVRTGSNVADFYKWKNFTFEQSDTVADQNLWDAYVASVAGDSASARKKVSKMIYPSEHQNNRETYLRLIEERGLKPRFSSFLDNPNYMKLVNETRQSEAETVALKPVFDVDAAEAAFQKFVDKGGYYEGWYNDGIDVESEAETVAQDVLAGKKANEVSYGRQDIDAEGIQRGRKSNREHGRRFALQIGDTEVSTKGRYQLETDSETLLRDISEQNSIEQFMPEGLSADFLKAIRRSNGFAPSRLYRGMEAAEMDYIIENGFIKSNSSYNFANQQGQTRFSPQIQTALSYATGFAPAGIRERFFEQGLPAYIVEVGNYADLNFVNEDTMESYTKKEIDTKYITRVIELTYDAETNKVKARDIQIDGMNQAKGELLHGVPSFVQDKVTGTILYEHQDTEGYEDGKYISEKNPDILFDYDMVEAHKGMSFDYNGYLGISGDPANLVPYKADGKRYALDTESYSYDALTKKPDLAVVALPAEIPQTADGKVDKKAILARGKLNARKQKNPNNTDTDTYVRVDDIGLDVLLGAKGLQHGLARSEETALAVMKIGDILRGSVAVNELNGNASRKTDMSYVLLGACHDSDSLYVVRSVVSKLQNDVTEIDVYQLSAVKGKKTETPNSALKRGAAVTEQSSLISSESPVISIADFLQAVKEIPLINEIFSEDVAAKLGVTRSEGTLSGDLRYALSETADSVGVERKEYKPSIKEKVFSAKDSIYIDTVDELYGAEKYLRKVGKRRDAAGIVQSVRASSNQAQVMIGNAQHDIFSENGGELGVGLQRIFKKVLLRGEKVCIDFDDYLLHHLNVDRMTLEQRSIAEQEARQEDLKAKVSALKKLNKRIKKLQEQIKALGRSKKDMETKRGLREELAKAKAEAKALKKEATELDKAIKVFTPLENKPVFGESDKRAKTVSAEESEAQIRRYEEVHPKFRELAEQVWKYNKNLLHLRVEAGLVSAESEAVMNKLYPHYVPSFRDVDFRDAGTIKGKSNLEISNTIKRAKGGGFDIMSVSHSMAEQTLQVVRAGNINRLFNAIYAAAVESGDTEYVEVVSRENVSHSAYETNDIEIKPKSNRITGYVNGEKVTLSVAREIFLAFDGLNKPTVDPDSSIEKALAWLNKGYKRLLTSYSPAFALRNPIRDLQDAGLNSKHPAIFAKNYPLAFQKMLRNTKEWQSYMAHGGYASSVFEGRDFSANVDSRGFEAFVKLLDSDATTVKKVLGAVKGTGKNVLTAIENLNAFVEQATRFAEYLASIEAGDSIQTAVYNSAEVSTNFGRKGRKTKKLNATIMPFLNPAIQGFDKMFRNITDAFSSDNVVKALSTLLVKVAIVGLAPMLANLLMYGDDEDYENLREADKENNFLIKAGDTFIKIPRGRVASVIGGVLNRSVRAAQGKDADIGDFASNVINQVTPVQNFSRTILHPVLVDLPSNTTWYGSAIEGRQFENTAPKDRYDENTSSIAIAIGQLINYSPKKIHYLLDQYSGVIGDFILPATTAKAEKDFLSGNFTLDPATSNKLSTEFYEMYDQAQYTKTAGDDTAAYQVRYLNKVKSAISDMYKQKSEIQNNPDLSNAEKLQQTRVVQLLINEAYKTALQDFELYTKAIEATAGMEDENLRFTEATRLMYGAERALSEYNDDVYAKCQMLNKAGVDYETLYSYYFTVRGITSDKDAQSNTVSGSKRKKVVASIKSMKITADQKLLLICASGYTLQDNDLPRMSAVNAKKRLLRYILNLKGATQTEKTELAEMCGFEVKNGRVVTKSAFSIG